MTRISIELTQEHHQKITAMAALTDTSIREVVAGLLPASSDEKYWL